MVNTNRIPFLNTYVDNLTFAEAKSCVDELIQEPGYHYVVTPNTDIVMKMQNDPELKQICESADLILTDGMFIVKSSRKTNHPIKERVCMTDFVWDVCDLADEKNYSVFFFGGKEEVLEKAVNVIRDKYSKLNIAGYYSPPPGFEKDTEELENANERIRISGADILIVFLGCPKQEKFIANNKEKYQIPISITMGGCVDFIAGNVKRAPKWMQDRGMEWFYRFLQEPRRMYKRYFIDDVKIFGMVRKYKNR